MNCPNCNKEIGNTDFCPFCGTKIDISSGTPPPFATQPPPVMEQVPNHLVWSILVTLLCCLPFGIVAIIYSSKVNTSLAMGDIAGAKGNAKTAKTWCIVGALCGIITYVIVIFGSVLPVLMGRTCTALQEELIQQQLLQKSSQYENTTDSTEFEELPSGGE